jgi:hypothetical protein
MTTDTSILLITLVILLLGGAALYKLHVDQRRDDRELEELRLRALDALRRERQ